MDVSSSTISTVHGTVMQHPVNDVSRRDTGCCTTVPLTVKTILDDTYMHTCLPEPKFKRYCSAENAVKGSL